MVLIEFSKLPSEHGSGKQNTLDESFILHSRDIQPLHLHSLTQTRSRDKRQEE